MKNGVVLRKNLNLIEKIEKKSEYDRRNMKGNEVCV